MSNGTPEEPQQIEQELDHIARVASAMVDGDACQRIVTPRALKYMFMSDPHNRYAAGDNYDVNDAEFNAVKKTLIRLSRIAPFPCDVNLWLPIEGHPGKVQAVIRNVNELSQFYVFGRLDQDMVPHMQTVLDSGQRVTVKDKPEWISVLGPVYNSLGDIICLVEAVSRTTPPVRTEEE